MYLFSPSKKKKKAQLPDAYTSSRSAPATSCWEVSNKKHKNSNFLGTPHAITKAQHLMSCSPKPCTNLTALPGLGSSLPAANAGKWDTLITWASRRGNSEGVWEMQGTGTTKHHPVRQKKKKERNNIKTKQRKPSQTYICTYTKIHIEFLHSSSLSQLSVHYCLPFPFYGIDRRKFVTYNCAKTPMNWVNVN